MLKKVMDLWFKNKDKLEADLAQDKSLNACNYVYLVKKVVEHILNDEEVMWDSRNITTIDNGDWQGTLLFLIPGRTYQPSACEYLITCVDYGSCSGCDTLQGIQEWHYESRVPTKEQLKDYMRLCLHLCENMIKPYPGGWRIDESWDVVLEEGKIYD